MDELRILVVDDEEMIRWSVGEMIRRRGDRCELAADGPEALDIIEKHDFDIMITDLYMPGMNGLELVKRVKEIRPQVVCIVLTGAGTRKDVINAIKEGVFDFIEKPIHDLSTFSMAIDRAGERAGLVRERDSLLVDLKVKNAKLEVGLAQLHNAYSKLQRQEKILESDLCQAQRMQQRLLPSEFPDIAGLDFFGYFCPCSRLGGDFFGAIPLRDDRVGLYLADVAGHGVSAAMVTVIIRELIHGQHVFFPDSGIFDTPPKALEFINKGLLGEKFDPPILVTMVYAVIDGRAGEVTVGCAGHPPPILVSGPGQTCFLPAHGPVLGISSSSKFVTARFKLRPGDFFLMYSDGLSEARNPEGEDMTEERLARMAGSVHRLEAFKVGQRLERELREFQANTAAEDDETFLVVGRTGSRGEEGKSALEVREKKEPVRPVKIADGAARAGERAALRAHVEGGMDGKTCVVMLVGKSTWRQAPAFQALVAEAVGNKVETIHLDLSKCQFLDSTLLGLIYSFSSTLAIHAPNAKALGQFREMGILDVLTVAGEPPPHMPLREKTLDHVSEEQQATLILSAHESLMEISEENRKKFGPAVEMMREKSGKD